MKSYLNLGCGSRYHPTWTNIDIVAHGPEVIQHDLSHGIPLPDASCDAVYHSAVFEHIRRADAPTFLQECHRVLKPGGVIRVGVPNLERLCRLYLEKLELAVVGDENAAHDYDWIMLELYDQTVREQSGGDMLTYLRQNPMPNEEFVYAQIGEEGRQLVQMIRQRNKLQLVQPAQGKEPFLHKVRRRIFTMPKIVKQRLLTRWLGENYLRALAIGRFRLAGEVHQWMYDRYSLARLLQETGFINPIMHDAMSSQIPDWNTFHLDTLPDGTVIKPDLFFMEATKPRQ
jgi:predicted SAM-dependent methyltransferase